MDKVCSPIIRGNLKELIRISSPLMVFLFFEVLTVFCERIFLSYHSLEAVHASLNASYLATLFQSPCVAIGMMAQVFVGIYYGSSQYQRIGPCVWQLIWFSFLSFLITFPLSLLASSWYFRSTIIQRVGSEYFTTLALANFLFPLNAALSSFYLGRGKIFFVTILMVVSYALNLLLSWLLIFGVEGMIPSLGAKGAALAKCMSLGAVCCAFLSSFLTRKNREIYHTHSWRFSPSALWHYMYPGMVRAFGYLFSSLCWASITYLIIKKGGKYLDVLTIGGTIVTFLVFITNGIYKAILTITSHLIGAKKYEEIWNLCRSFVMYIMVIAVFLMIPLIFFPKTMIYFFDSSLKELFKQTFKSIHYWIWLYILTLTLQMSFCAVLIALRDLKFQFYCYLLMCPMFLIPVYLGLYQGKWEADKLWVIVTIGNIVFMLLFLIRLRQKKWEEEQLQMKYPHLKFIREEEH